MSKLVEEWKDIEGYEGLYQVSDWGNVKSLPRLSKRSTSRHRGTSILINERILKQSFQTSGYKVVVLCKDGNNRQFQVHRLVAEAFIPNPENKPQIDHINTNKAENNVENLRWCTHTENMNNPITLLKKSKLI